jgi:hypothetical protein
MQGSLETPLPPVCTASGSESANPNAWHCDQWEALEHKNKPRGILQGRAAGGGIPQDVLIFVPHGFPFFQAIQPRQFFEYLCNLRNLPAIASRSGEADGRSGRVCVQEVLEYWVTNFLLVEAKRRSR